MKFWFVHFGLLLFLICISIFYMFENHRTLLDVKDEIDRIQRLEMYDDKLENNTKKNGIYFGKGYYCVWTKGREGDVSNIDPEISRVQETAIHEMTHALIDNDYKHFCGEK